MRTKVRRAGVEGWRYRVYLANKTVDYWPILRVDKDEVDTMPEGSKVAGELRNAEEKVIYVPHPESLRRPGARYLRGLRTR